MKNKLNKLKIKITKTETIDIAFKGMPNEWLKCRVIAKRFIFCKLPNVFRGFLYHLIFIQKQNPKDWINKPEIKKIIKKYKLNKSVPKVFYGSLAGYCRDISSIRKWELTNSSQTIDTLDFRFYYLKKLWRKLAKY